MNATETVIEMAKEVGFDLAAKLDPSTIVLRDEVRAACGEGWAWYNPDEPHGVSKTADESGGWFFSAGVGTDDGWRFGVWFDESGRVKEKDAYYWYD